MIKTYALVVVSCCDKTEVVKESMTISALNGFMGSRGEGGGAERLPLSRHFLGNVTLLSIVDFARSLVSHLPKLFPLFCTFFPRQKKDATKKGTSPRKENPSGSP